MGGKLMQTIQPFIDLGWYTVPLKGNLKRLEDGSKTTPQFEKNWKANYQQQFNESATDIGGVITGSVSNIIAIDCDDDNTYKMFSMLDTDYAFHFISKNKPKGGGTIIYNYPTGELLPSFSIQDEIMSLDFYSDEGFVYLPTEPNLTKEPWLQKDMTALPKLKPLPPQVLLLLQALHKQHKLGQAPQAQQTNLAAIQKYNYLAPQVELFIAKEEFIPSLFHIITPKDFRTLTQYVKLGYVHPKDVPDGRGSEYLMKVSAILGADPSIDREMYMKAMYLINDLWDNPLAASRFESTILNPMADGKASVDGAPIWSYDEQWNTRGLAFINKLGEAIEVFFDDVRALYYLINYTKGTTKTFYRDADIYSYVETVGVAPPTRKEMKPVMPIVRTVINPSLPFGFYSPDEYSREFNIFKQTPALAILTEPGPYKDSYERPETILAYLETLVPDNVQRHYLLRFLKTKLTTFGYSPVVLYFLGAHGSGKDVFINLLASILGTEYVARPSTREFLEQFNGWMVDKYFAQLDEYGNQLSRLTDKQEALGKIKSYSGKEAVQIRQMRTDGFTYNHKLTLIMTANNNPLMLEAGDRRVALLETPNVLKDADWVIKNGGVSTVVDMLSTEILDFCYYLATEVDLLSSDAYVNPPETEGKRAIIAQHLPAADRIAFYISNHMLNELYELAQDFNCEQVFEHYIEGRIYEDDLFELYIGMTDAKGTKRGLTKAMSMFTKVPTTSNGMKAYYYYIPELKHFSMPMAEIDL